MAGAFGIYTSMYFCVRHSQTPRFVKRPRPFMQKNGEQNACRSDKVGTAGIFLYIKSEAYYRDLTVFAPAKHKTVPTARKISHDRSVKSHP